jgi:hypothetical protein
MIKNIWLVVSFSAFSGLLIALSIPSFRAFIPLCYGLVLEGVLSEEQLKEKLFLNPKKIIEKGEYQLNLNA